MKVEKNRLIIIFLILIVALLAIFSKLIYLQVFRHDFFSRYQKKQMQRIINIYAKRGQILDRHGHILAMSRPAYSIYALPRKIDNPAQFVNDVAPILEKTESELRRLIDTNVPFVWLARKADESKKRALESLDLDTVNFIYEEKRVYPNAELAADVLGFVGTDGGLAGIEYQYNRTLRGSEGQIIVDTDPRGNALVSSDRSVQGSPKGFRIGIRGAEAASFDGHHVHTTLDMSIQYMAQKLLDEQIKKTEATAGQVVVMDPKTGDILALADSPAFDPNRFWEYDPISLKNSAIVDIFEPGSVFKLLTAAAYMEEKGVGVDYILTVPETIQVYNRTIKEAHKRKEDESDQKSIRDIIKESLNVGVSMMAMELGEETFDQYIRDFGFGSSYQMGLPGESPGLHRPVSRWSAVDIAMLSFGQGIGVTSLQLAAMTSVFANGGYLVKPRMIKYISDYEKLSIKGVATQKLRRVISKQTADKVLDTMLEVVENGTGRIVRIPGYHLGGKTGTAQKADEKGGYSETDYRASFVGVLSVKNPQAVIVVSIDTPRTSIWGSTVAGPVFRELSRYLIDYMDMETEPKLES